MIQEIAPGRIDSDAVEPGETSGSEPQPRLTDGGVLRAAAARYAGTLDKTLRSAVANAEQKEAQLDVDQLVVRKITVDKGPQEKRVRPAPMGRAYRVLHRKSHLTIELSDEA